ncbi:unnamed protein product [Paramecium primaurelia]|uniref:LITAF domain-containing protein n=1 Tax=Paramecium primaurelia TaxID=5886 RepID=A0A8S1MDV8_PARPR|nr:unnamed protein product [Paramecium primaurelia]
MQPNVQAYNYPVQKDGMNQPVDQQFYQQQQPINQGQGVPLGHPVNPQYIPVQQQQPFINGPVIIQPIVVQQIRRANADGCSYPADIICPYCQKAVQTFIKHKSGCHTWLACWLLFLFFLPLFFLPFCFEECLDKIHLCPNCGKKVGKKKYKMCG